jgi:hypothetical protein
MTETFSQNSLFDASPALKMYVESVEFWRKNFDNFVRSANEAQNAYAAAGKAANDATHAAENAASAADAALLNTHKSSEELFKRFVENQMELCRFFGARWEQYLKLPEQLSKCRSVTEFGSMQAQFMSQFASDYMHETEKLAKPVAEMMSNFAGSKAA